MLLAINSVDLIKNQYLYLSQDIYSMFFKIALSNEQQIDKFFYTGILLAINDVDFSNVPMRNDEIIIYVYVCVCT